MSYHFLKILKYYECMGIRVLQDHQSSSRPIPRPFLHIKQIVCSAQPASIYRNVCYLVRITKKSMQPQLRPGWRQIVVQCSTNWCTCVRTALYRVVVLFYFHYSTTIKCYNDIVNSNRIIFNCSSLKLPLILYTNSLNCAVHGTVK